jgi:hypothetical protein
LNSGIAKGYVVAASVLTAERRVVRASSRVPEGLMEFGRETRKNVCEGIVAAEEEIEDRARSAGYVGCLWYARK